jgi:hypothetical protein
MNKADVLAAMRAADLGAPVVVLVSKPQRGLAFDLVATGVSGNRKTVRVDASNGLANVADVTAAIETLKA